MAKGATYRLAEAEGYRRLCVPLSLWPALTGIISDNEFQFHPDCWAGLVQEVLNMPECGMYGWDGAVWRKLPLLWGFSERWSEVIEGVASGGGIANASTDAVPDGYVYVLQAAHASHDAAGDKALRIETFDSVVRVVLHYQPTAATAFYYPWVGEVVLKAGDIVRAITVAPGDGKKCYLHVWGYKMKVAEE